MKYSEYSRSYVQDRGDSKPYLFSPLPHFSFIFYQVFIGIIYYSRHIRTSLQPFFIPTLIQTLLTLCDSFTYLHLATSNCELPLKHEPRLFHHDLEMTQVDIVDENLLKLTQIQHVVKFEDGLESSIDEVLARVLDFYRRFVPYN